MQIIRIPTTIIIRMSGNALMLGKKKRDKNIYVGQILTSEQF